MNIHSYFSGFLLSAVSVLAFAAPNALTGIKFEEGEADLAKEVVLQLTIEDGGKDTYCGLRINWGDGTERKYRIGADAEIKPPFRISYKYATEGVKAITTTGEFMSRGLKSLPACEGSLTTTIKIIDFSKLKKERALEEAAKRAEDDQRALARKALLANEELVRQNRILTEQKAALEKEKQEAEIIRLRAELDKARQQAARNVQQKPAANPSVSTAGKPPVKIDTNDVKPPALPQKREGDWQM